MQDVKVANATPAPRRRLAKFHTRRADGTRWTRPSDGAKRAANRRRNRAARQARKVNR